MFKSIHRIAFLVSLYVFVCTTIVFSQNTPYLGSWLGTLSLPGQKLRLAFHISEQDGVLITKIDIPDQFSFGTPANKTSITDEGIYIEVALLGATYNGTLNQEQIFGTFRQAGMELELNLQRTTEKIEAPRRPQIPSAPFPYTSKDVVIKTADDKVKIAGTLTIPTGKGPFPAVILVSGSGPQNRDNELLGHKSFLVIADYLTRRGIAVLRYDDRGTGLSTGNFAKATTLDFSDDATSVLEYLSKQKKIDKSRLGVIGHSEGGIIAPIVASKSTHVDFLILLAGSSVPGSKILVDQSILILKNEDITDLERNNQIGLQRLIVQYITENKDNASLQSLLAKKIEEYITANTVNIPKTYSKSSFARQTAMQMTSPWMRQFITLDPAIYLEKLTIPTLALFGEKDIQVSPELNLEKMEELLKNNSSSRVQIIPNVNHLFQTADSGYPSEYGTIEETINPSVLEIIEQFIKSVK